MSLSQNSVNILLVDDNVSNLTILKEVLDRPDANIITCNIPTDVIDLCVKEDISIALIDVKMPGLSGFELLSLIKQNPLTENVVVILMTGYSMSSEEVFLGLSSGAVDYLFKPLDMHITNAKITSLLTLVNYQREVEKKNKELEFYQKDLFQAVEEAKKGKEIKENFLANMSHEIRTPLNAIVGITNLLKTSELDDQQKEMIRLMDFSSHALLGIVNDVLESFQIDAGKINLDLTDIDVTALFMSVTDTMRPLAVEKGLLLHHNIIGEVPAWVKADALRLNQILMNLINNAIKFTVAGQVEVTLKVGEKNDGRTALEFTVKDSGLGIPE
ncbi:MAG: response regulator, partial [Pedobacter sp.]|nr:response regulator [Pedobacter sp.]